MVEFNYNNLWKTFESRSNKAERQAKSHGVPFLKLYKTKEMFISNFKTLYYNDFSMSKTANQVIKYMVDKQRYTYNEKQGKTLVSALKTVYDKDISLREARIFGGMSIDEIEALPFNQRKIAQEIKLFYADQHKLYNELREQGYSAERAKQIVSITYYNSDDPTEE